MRVASLIVIVMLDAFPVTVSVQTTHPSTDCTQKCHSVLIGKHFAKVRRALYPADYSTGSCVRLSLSCRLRMLEHRLPAVQSPSSAPNLCAMRSQVRQACSLKVDIMLCRRSGKQQQPQRHHHCPGWQYTARAAASQHAQVTLPYQ